MALTGARLGSVYCVRVPTPIEVADSLEPELREQFLALIDVVAQAVPLEQLEEWLEERNFIAIINAFERIVGQSVTFVAASDLTATYASLVRGGLRSAVAGFGLDLTSELVLDRIRSDAGRLVVAVGQDTITSIRAILSRNYLDGLGTRAAGRVIRSVVGLLPSHAVAVGNYALGLENAGVPEPRRGHFVETYARRLLAYRAENIARTETISAAHAGQLEGWLEMANRGAIDRRRARLVWDVKEDDRLCPWCAPMDGQTVGLGEMFIATHKGFPEGKPENRGPGSERLKPRPLRPDPRSQPRDDQGRFLPFFAKRDERDELDGRLVELSKPIVVQHPPLHPQCRCTINLTFKS